MCSCSGPDMVVKVSKMFQKELQLTDTSTSICLLHLWSSCSLHSDNWTPWLRGDSIPRQCLYFVRSCSRTCCSTCKDTPSDHPWKWTDSPFAVLASLFGWVYLHSCKPHYDKSDQLSCS